MDKIHEELDHLENMGKYANLTRNPVRPIDESKYWTTRVEELEKIDENTEFGKTSHQRYILMSEKLQNDNRKHNSKYWSTVAKTFSLDASHMALRTRKIIDKSKHDVKSLEDENRILSLLDSAEHFDYLARMFGKIADNLSNEFYIPVHKPLEAQYWAGIAKYYADLSKEFISTSKDYRPKSTLDEIVSFRCEHPELTETIYEENCVEPDEK